MNNIFHPIDIENWERKGEYDFFEYSGCCFTMTADVDITGLYNYAKQQKVKLYPLLVAALARIVNTHTEFKYGMRDGQLGTYEQVHPLFFDATPSGAPKALCAEYRENLLEQVAEIEAVRTRWADSTEYRPQGNEIPQNNVNISCVPWVKFTGLSFSMQNSAYYFPPILTYGKFSRIDGRIIIPLSAYCNHRVNDGWHCSLFFTELKSISSGLEKLKEV